MVSRADCVNDTKMIAEGRGIHMIVICTKYMGEASIPRKWPSPYTMVIRECVKRRTVHCEKLVKRLKQ